MSAVIVFADEFVSNNEGLGIIGTDHAFKHFTYYDTWLCWWNHLCHWNIMYPCTHQESVSTHTIILGWKIHIHWGMFGIMLHFTEFTEWLMVKIFTRELKYG